MTGLSYNGNGELDVADVHTFTLDDIEVALTAADRRLLRKTAANPDMFLPFSYHTPSAQSLRLLLSGQTPNILLTDVGFKNLVAVRYISYNAPFLITGEQKFTHNVGELVAAFNREPRRPQEYFLVNNIYGTNRTRRMDRLPAVWAACIWPHEFGRDFHVVWRAIACSEGKGKKYRIPNVGPLLALLICSTTTTFRPCVE